MKEVRELAALLAVVTLNACSTRVLEVRTGAPARIEGRRTLVVADVPPLERRAMEDAIVERLPGAVSSHRLAGGDELRRKARVASAPGSDLAGEWDALVIAEIVDSSSHESEIPYGLGAGGTPAGMGLPVGAVSPEGYGVPYGGGTVITKELLLDVSVVRMADGKEIFGVTVRDRGPLEGSLLLAAEAAARAAREIAKAGILR